MIDNRELEIIELIKNKKVASSKEVYESVSDSILSLIL